MVSPVLNRNILVLLLVLKRNEIIGSVGYCDTCSSRCYMKCLTDVIIERKESLDPVEDAACLNNGHHFILAVEECKSFTKTLTALLEKIDKLGFSVDDSKQKFAIFLSHKLISIISLKVWSSKYRDTRFKGENKRMIFTVMSFAISVMT